MHNVAKIPTRHENILIKSVEISFSVADHAAQVSIISCVLVLRVELGKMEVQVIGKERLPLMENVVKIPTVKFVGLELKFPKVCWTSIM